MPLELSKQYATVADGQVHYRIANPDGENRPLLCLHPAPSSGLYFETLMPLLARNRPIICPDYPGYGGSYPLDTPPSIGDYAFVMLQFIETLQLKSPIDIMGFHTGCLVGAEMSLQAAEKFGELILCDVPYFSAGQRRELIESSASPLALTEELQSLSAAWEFNVTKRIGDASLVRSLALFTEQLRGSTKDHYAFRAAFSYDCEQRLPSLAGKVSIIATKSGLRSATLVAAEQIPNAQLIDASDIEGKVFESNAGTIANYILNCLSNTHG